MLSRVYIKQSLARALAEILMDRKGFSDLGNSKFNRGSYMSAHVLLN